MPRTLVEKILRGHTDADDVSLGKIIMGRCDLVYSQRCPRIRSLPSDEEDGREKVLDLEIGQPIIAQADATVTARLQSEIHIDIDSGETEVYGDRFASGPLSQFIQDMISSGSLTLWGHQKRSKNHGSV